MTCIYVYITIYAIHFTNNFNTNSIKEKYDNKEKIKMDLISLNKQIKDMQNEMKLLLNDNAKNNDCLKYTHFLFDKAYTKYNWYR